MDVVTLPEKWFSYEIAEGADPSRPGLYEWKINGVGSYIGKYKRISRPLKHYTRNVQNLFAGKPYRKGKPKLFRRIHHELAAAVKSKTPIRLIILENPALDNIKRREHELIRERGNLNGSEEKLGKIARQKPKREAEARQQKRHRSQKDGTIQKLSSDLISRLKKYAVSRYQIAEELRIPKGIAGILRRTARELKPPHLLERRYKGQQYKVEYHLRPTEPGEEAGQIVEVETFSR